MTAPSPSVSPGAPANWTVSVLSWAITTPAYMPSVPVVRNRIGIGGGGAVHHVKAADLSAEDQAAAVSARDADAVVGKDLAELDGRPDCAFQRSGRERQPAFHPGVLVGDEGVHNGVNIQIDRGGIIDDKLAVSLVQ